MLLVRVNFSLLRTRTGTLALAFQLVSGWSRISMSTGILGHWVGQPLDGVCPECGYGTVLAWHKARAAGVTRLGMPTKRTSLRTNYGKATFGCSDSQVGLRGWCLQPLLQCGCSPALFLPTRASSPPRTSQHTADAKRSWTCLEPLGSRQRSRGKCASRCGNWSCLYFCDADWTDSKNSVSKLE